MQRPKVQLISHALSVGSLEAVLKMKKLVVKGMQTIFQHPYIKRKERRECICIMSLDKECVRLESVGALTKPTSCSTEEKVLSTLTTYKNVSTPPTQGFFV